MSKVKVLFKKWYSDAQLPQQAHAGDAGMDLYSYEDAVIQPRSIDGPLPVEGRHLIDCGFAMALPQGWEAQIRPRSGTAAKKGITVVNTPGTIDAGYRGQVKVCLLNLGATPFVVKKGDRIAQMVISEVPHVDVEEVDQLPMSSRGEGGFGSTGK